MLMIKTKTIWYILLAIILFSSFVMTYYRYIGLVLFGVSSYIAGAYHIKFSLERDLDGPGTKKSE